MKKLKPTDLEGFVHGEHQPYTDYNEDIMNWLKDNAKVSIYIGNRNYIFTQEENFYTHNICFATDIYYTNEQFMELIGMTKPSGNNTFTKADLKDGMICTNRSGSVYTVRGDRMVNEGGFVYLNDINDDLTISGSFGHILDIVRVEQPIVVFERYELKQQAIRKELEFAEAKKQRLEAHINVLKSKLK